jgi:hypothetical protein
MHLVQPPKQSYVHAASVIEIYVMTQCIPQLHASAYGCEAKEVVQT